MAPRSQRDVNNLVPHADSTYMRGSIQGPFRVIAAASNKSGRVSLTACRGPNPLASVCVAIWLVVGWCGAQEGHGRGGPGQARSRWGWLGEGAGGAAPALAVAGAGAGAGAAAVEIQVERQGEGQVRCCPWGALEWAVGWVAGVLVPGQY